MPTGTGSIPPLAMDDRSASLREPRGSRRRARRLHSRLLLHITLTTSLDASRRLHPRSPTMATATADLGLVGLAVMGENLVLNMESHGFTVAVFNRTTARVDDFLNARAKGKKI